MRTKKAPQNMLMRRDSLILIRALIVVAAVVAVPFYSVRSSSLPGSGEGSAKEMRGTGRAHGPNSGVLTPVALPLSALLVLPATPPSESIATFAGDCVTPKSDWNLGETVCVEVADAPVSSSRVTRRINLVDPAGFAVAFQDVAMGSPSQEARFTLPTAPTDTLFGIPIDNRGTWRLDLTDTSDASVPTFASIIVHDPAGAVTDLQITKTNVGDTQATAGSDIQVLIWVFNYGPDAAQNVQVTDVPPANTTFQSLTQPTGPTFTCTTPTVDTSGTSTCTRASLNKDEKAGFIITYRVNSNVGSGTESSSSASVSSSTTVRSADDNNSTSTTTLNNPTPPPCTVTCPNNISATADTTENDANGNPVRGTHVTYSDPTTSGTCDTITTSPASGSFFPVGSTVVSATSSTGGGSCTFTVTVTDSGSPVAITCPSNKVASADSNCEATVDPGTPTTTGDNVTVTASRSDGKPLRDANNQLVPFPAGVTTVTWTASNSSGTEHCDQTVTVNDITPPTITAPPTQTASANATCQAAVPDFTTNTTVTDNCACASSDSSDGCVDRVRITVTQDPAPGTMAGLGPHTITLTANDGSSNNDGAGNTATAMTTFTVNDTTAPTITCPADITTGNTAGQCSATVDPGTATATDNCDSNPTVTGARSDALALSAAYPVGTTTITWTATDSSGNHSSCTQTVTVNDTENPTITAPPNVTANTGPGRTTCDAIVSDATLGTASANDNCAGVTVSHSPSGNTFQVGATTVTWTATDAHGNTATATQTVTVIDNTPPVVTRPANVTAFTGPSATSCATVVSDVTLGVASASDNCPGVSGVTRTGVPSGNVFPVGTTAITYSASDAHGNTASATQTVTVIDNTPPVISCPANITFNLPLNTTATSMVVNYTAPVGTDNCAGATTAQTAGLASGASFPVGTTTNTFRATDAVGNFTDCSFTVTVLYDFTGFFSPVNNLPTLNVVNAGQAIPVKFSLSGNKGLNIFAVDSPQSGVIPCDASAPATDLTDTVTAGSSSLSYSAGSDQYTYVWKTDSSWAGTCRQLVITLNDGSVHTANFKFR